jgi:hypothetical protein
MAGLVLAGLDPLRALIEGKAEGDAVGDGAAADPLARLDHQHALVRRHQGARRGEARDAGADDDDIEIGGAGRPADAERQRRHGGPRQGGPRQGGRPQQATALHSFQVKGKSCWRTKPGGM